MAQWDKLNFVQQNCVASAGKLMQQAVMVAPGARVGVALSGGVDSWVLLKVLQYRQRILPFPIEVMALHVNPGFDPHNHAPMLAWVKREGIAAHIETSEHGPRGHSPENRKNSACFYCSRLRRKSLFELAARYKLTHLALGHNADDLLSTFFLNLFQAGRVQTLLPNQSFFKGRLSVIRPLLWLEKKTIAKACRAWDLPVWTNPCPSAGTSRRATIMQDLEAVWKTDRRQRQNVLNALRRFAGPRADSPQTGMALDKAGPGR